MTKSKSANSNDEQLRWPVQRRTPGAEYRVFRTEFVECTNPRSGATKQFSTLVCADWVNVIAITPDHHVVTLRQYRPGTNRICLEIPGGMIDDGEAPSVAAARELEEETGFIATQWLALGQCAPNPALQNNALHMYLALNATPTGTARPDDGEVLAVTTLPMADVLHLLRTGAVEHALVLAAFAHLALSHPELMARSI